LRPSPAKLFGCCRCDFRFNARPPVSLAKAYGLAKKTYKL
jgi:hypothetical protein